MNHKYQNHSSNRRDFEKHLQVFHPSFKKTSQKPYHLHLITNKNLKFLYPEIEIIQKIENELFEISQKSAKDVKEKFQVYPLSLKESSQKFLDIQKYLREKLQSSFVDTNTKSSTEKEESGEFLDLQKSSPATVPLPATCSTFFSATSLTSFFGWKPKSDVVATICQDLALNQFVSVTTNPMFKRHFLDGKHQSKPSLFQPPKPPFKPSSSPPLPTPPPKSPDSLPPLPTLTLLSQILEPPPSDLTSEPPNLSPPSNQYIFATTGETNGFSTVNFVGLVFLAATFSFHGKRQC